MSGLTTYDDGNAQQRESAASQNAPPSPMQTLPSHDVQARNGSIPRPQNLAAATPSSTSRPAADASGTDVKYETRSSIAESVPCNSPVSSSRVDYGDDAESLEVIARRYT